MNRRHPLGGIAAVALAVVLVSPAGASSNRQPALLGRAVLPVATYAAGPPSGAFFDGQTINGVAFATPSQPVQGFSAVIDGRRHGEYLAMPDNGYGGKANSYDFLIRAYYVEPRFETADGGPGEVVVKDFISFRDPNRLIGFPIVNEDTTARLLTGQDIDPESIQRAHNGDYWVGDEFGPWLLHFDRAGVLLDPPFATPGGLMSPNNPFLGSAAATQPNSRGFEATAIAPDGRHLYAVLEGPTVAAGTLSLDRLVFEFDVRHERFTGRTWTYQVHAATNMVSDIDALDAHRFVLIERDGGRGLTAVDRKVFAIDLRGGHDHAVDARLLVDLAAVPDPALISLPALHAGDVGLGDPFRVTSESVEAIHVLPGGRLLIGCDNNFPNTGRNPGLADDNEFIVVGVPGLTHR